MDIPFLFRDTAHARAVLDGAFGRDLLGKFQSVAWLRWPGVSRASPPDEQQAPGTEDRIWPEIRVTENPVHITAFKTLGASAHAHVLA